MTTLPFCPACGARVERRVPDGDNRPRRVCVSCHVVHYDNPKVVVGAVCFAGERVLLCRRAIPPRTGYWTLPAGFLEDGESIDDGTHREAHEEACARLAIKGLLGVYSLPHISQVQIISLAELLDDAVAPGPESEAVALFAPTEIPWDALAFPTVRWALERALATRGASVVVPEVRVRDAPSLVPDDG